jgi:hypothetical protein
MVSLADIERDFAAAIRDQDLPPPPGTRGRCGEMPSRRFAIYRNNVHVSLIEALAATFPVVARLVGEDFFRAMARAYVGEQLPRTPVLIDYGDGFTDFVERFAPARQLPYLADVARLEWARSRAYHAAEATALTTTDLAAIRPELVPTARLGLHPSLRIVSSDWPVLDIWETNSHDAVVRPVDLSTGGVDVAVLRPDVQVELHRLAAGWRTMLVRLLEGARLADAWESAAAADDIDLVAFLGWLIAAGAITEVAMADGAESRR